MASTSKISKTVKVDKNEDPNHKMIEESITKPEKNKGFFTRRNIFLLILFFILSITLLALTIVFILKIDFSNLWHSMSLGFGDKLGGLWFTLLLFYFVWTIFSVFAMVMPRLNKLGYKIPLWEYWLFGLTISFFRATTPVLFSDPYFVFWLKTKGVPTSRATSLIFSNTLFWQIIQFVVTLPSFIMVSILANELLSSPEGISSFAFLCAGMIIDVFSIVIMFMLNMSKNIHYALSRAFNWVKMKLHMKYHTKQETIEKYKYRETIKRDFIEYLKDWKNTILIMVLLVLGEVITYLSVNLSLHFMRHYDSSTITSFNFGWAFNSANVTFTANRLNFIAPGGEGSLQFFLSTFLIKLGEFKPSEQPEVVKSVVNNAILVWRTFASYLPALFGLCGLVGLTSIQVHRYKKNKSIIK